MNSDETDARQELRSLTTDIVSAYLGNNSVSLSSLPEVIASVHSALQALSAPAPEPVAERPVPHIPIKKTITHDYLISLEDQRHYKSLKRHLGGRGLTPDQYREKWGLPRDYPMVAPSYAQQRSELAKSIGLGQIRKKETQVAAPANDVAEAPKRRGRPKKAA